MLSDDEILEAAKQRFEECKRVQEITWRPQEVNESYRVVEGKQWLQDEYDKVIADGLTPYTINEVAPIKDSITGFQIQNRSEVAYTPRMHGLDKEKAAKYAEMIDNGVDHIERKSQVAFQDSLAFDDALICGVGATDNIIAYEENVNGETEVERVSPRFLLWDPAARKKNLKDRNWCARAKIVATESLQDEMDDNERPDNGVPFSFDDAWILDYVDCTGSEIELSVVYDYQWRTKEVVYRIRNPFTEHADNSLVLNWLSIKDENGKTVEQKLGFTLEDRLFTFTKQNWAMFKKSCEALGVELKTPDKQRKFKYYRAVIWGGKVREKSENYSQKGFSLQFITGKYSETDQSWYGILRAMKPAQRLLNQAITDFQGYIRTAPKGGFFMEADAVENLPAFKRTLAKARELTILKSGAIQQGKLLPKTPAPMPPGLLEMIQFASNALMRVVGVTPEWMGQFNTKDMTAALQKQLVKQGLTVLSWIFDAYKFYKIDQGYLFIDALRILAQNDPGRLIRNVTGASDDMFIELLEENIAPDYDIEVLDIPMSDNEKADTFQAMGEMAGAVIQTNPPLASALYSEALEFSPLKQDQVERIKQAAAPQPPPPPDPVQQGLIQSQSALNMAQADKYTAESTKTHMDSLLKYQELQGGDKPDVTTPTELAIKVKGLELKEQELVLKSAQTQSDHKIKSAKVISDHAIGEQQASSKNGAAPAAKSTPAVTPKSDGNIIKGLESLTKAMIRGQDSMQKTMVSMQQQNNDNMQRVMKVIASPKRATKSANGDITVQTVLN